MKYEIYSESTPKEKSPVRLRLVQDPDGTVNVVAVEGGGRVWMYLIAFTPEGRLTRQSFIDPALGLDLDDRGRIKLEGE
jgi:hypothetical protein